MSNPHPTHRRIIFWWVFLRSPQVTLASFLTLAVIALLIFIIPQYASVNNGTLGLLSGFIHELFLATSPNYILNTLFFWLPVALLTLNSFIALADYSQPTWQRWQNTPEISWQHPLAHRVEITTDPSASLQHLKSNLIKYNFTPHEIIIANDIKIVASQNRLGWWGPVGFYLGCLSLVLALMGSHYLAQSNYIQLLPQNSQESTLAQGNFKLIKVDDQGRLGQIEYTFQNNSPQELTWSLYWPKWLHNNLAILTEFQPMLKVSATNNQGQAIRLMPIQEDLSPDEQIYLPLNDDPVYFRISSIGLNFQVIPQTESEYNVQIQQQNETIPAINLTTKTGEPFKVDSFTVTFTLTHQVKLMIYRNETLPLYLLTFILLIMSLGYSFMRPPVQFWFIQESNGQLYSVAEGFKSAQKLQQFIQLLLESKSSDLVVKSEDLDSSL